MGARHRANVPEGPAGSDGDVHMVRLVLGPSSAGSALTVGRIIVVVRAGGRIVRVHVINPDRSAYRWAEFCSGNHHLSDVERFGALDGGKLDITALVREGVASADVLNTYSLSSLGTAVSHARLWDVTIEQGQALTIAEDDAIFNSHYVSCAADLIGTLPASWDLVLWGWNFDAFFCFEMLPGVLDLSRSIRAGSVAHECGRFPGAAHSVPCFPAGVGFRGALLHTHSKGGTGAQERRLPVRPRFSEFPARPEGTALQYAVAHAWGSIF